MAVPKKKTSKSKTRTRHSAYIKKQVTKLTKRVHLVACPKCGATKLNHRVCQACGFYGDKQIIDNSKKIDEVTTIKA